MNNNTGTSGTRTNNLYIGRSYTARQANAAINARRGQMTGGGCFVGSILLLALIVTILVVILPHVR